MHRVLMFGCLTLLCHAQDVYTIAGRVIRHSDQRPLAGAQVSISMVNGEASQVSVISGENGEFGFRGVPAAKYRLQVTDHGASRLYQQFENYSTAIVTGPDLDTSHILFTLDMPALIKGTVLDEDNDPVAHVQVYLFCQSLFEGKRETRIQNHLATDSGGGLRFHNLERGTYYLAVVARPWYAQISNTPDSHSDLDVAYPTTYYPGATIADEAAPINLAEGQTAEVQMILHAVPALHVKPQGPDGSRQGGIRVTQKSLGGAEIYIPAIQMNTDLRGIAPGTYTLSNGGSTQTAALMSDTTVDLTANAKAPIKGKVIGETGDVLKRLRVALFDEASQPMVSNALPADGSFEMADVSTGHYSLAIANDVNYYLSRVEVKGAPYRNGLLDLEAGAQAELTLTVGHGLARVDGLAMQATKPVAGAMVLLVPQNRNLNPTPHRDQSDSDGSFTLFAVPPGRYTLIAIDDGRGLAYANPQLISPYLPQGQVVDVPLDKPVSIQVQRRLQ